MSLHPKLPAWKQPRKLQVWTSYRQMKLAKLAAQQSAQTLAAFVRAAIWERVRGVLPERTIERYDRRR